MIKRVKVKNSFLIVIESYNDYDFPTQSNDG